MGGYTVSDVMAGLNSHNYYFQQIYEVSDFTFLSDHIRRSIRRLSIRCTTKHDKERLEVDRRGSGS